MAFRFTWPEFDKDFYVEAKSQLETALNKGNKPSVIVDHITVKELNMGTKPPELEILEIGELGTDKFRGIFKLNYAGDAYIEVQTKVQANPMHAKATISELPRHSRPGILAADQPLVVPMILRISEVKLRGIVVLVVSKTKGVTLVFKNDPLESIRISSTFDSISILRDFLQRQIESQLRNMLQEDLPVMIHNLSLRFIQSEEEKKKKLEEKERLLQKQQRQRSWTNSTASSDLSSLPELDDSYSLTPTSSSSTLSTLFTPADHIVTAFDYSSNYYNNSSNMIDQINNSSDYFHCKSVPITAANLFTHNRTMMMNQLGIHMRQEQQDLISDNGLSCYTYSCPSMSEIYTDNADAPWYSIEGPELTSTAAVAETIIPLIMDEKSIILNLDENRMAAKLLKLTTINYTLSPLTESISNFTFRSLPYYINNKKAISATTNRHKKIPKRRITRLNMSIPHL